MEITHLSQWIGISLLAGAFVLFLGWVVWVYSGWKGVLLTVGTVTVVVVVLALAFGWWVF